MFLLTYMYFNPVVVSSFQFIYRIREWAYSRVIYYSSMLVYQIVSVPIVNLSQLLDCCSFPYLTVVNTSYRNFNAKKISLSYVISLVHMLKYSIPETKFFIGFVCITYMKNGCTNFYNVNIFPYPYRCWLL